VEDAPELDHPWRYFAECPECVLEASEATWWRNLLKAWPAATGPRTAEGKASSAANLAGHPTPEEARRTRFNAVKSLAFAKTATYFPAKPGSYPQCERCDHLRDESCRPHGACLKRSEVFLRFHVAFERRDPNLLRDLWAENHAALQALFSDMVMTIVADGGPRLRSPEYYYDKDGGCHFVKYSDAETGEVQQLMKLEAHPLLKPLINLMNKAGLTMADMAMTPKAVDQEDMMRGYLDAEREDRESAGEFRGRVDRGMQQLRQLLGVRGPALIEGKVADK